MNNLNSLHEIKSVADFLAVMDGSLYSQRARWIYRGHSNYEYKLIPSVGRLYGSKNFQSTKLLYGFEKQAFSEFTIRSYSKFREGNKIVNLAIAQHHGLKTRLLDWTFSPLIALFFAVEDENMYNHDGALFAYENTNEYNSKNIDPHDINQYEKDYYFIYSPDLTNRISAQSGIFQLFKNPEKEFDEDFYLHKILIKAENKKTIKWELLRLGVSYDTVYPEIDGISKTINYMKLNAKLD